MKNVLLILLVVLLGFGVLAASQVEYVTYMPLAMKSGYYPGVPTFTPTPDPTATKTPRPPTPTPTATPTYVWAEGGNTCVHMDGAVRDKSTGGVIAGGLVPSLCSHMIVHDTQQDGKLVILRAIRIKTDTWGCEEGDFGYWPPIDFPCPSPDDPISEWGQILWGDYDVIKLDNSAQTVCGYCEECGEPYTRNCVEVRK